MTVPFLGFGVHPFHLLVVRVLGCKRLTGPQLCAIGSCGCIVWGMPRPVSDSFRTRDGLNRRNSLPMRELPPPEEFPVPGNNFLLGQLRSI